MNPSISLLTLREPLASPLVMIVFGMGIEKVAFGAYEIWIWVGHCNVSRESVDQWELVCVSVCCVS